MAVRRLAEHQPEEFSFSPENRAWAERQISKFPPGRQASAVIPLLWRAQEQEGWVTKPAIEGVAAMLGMPTIRVLEVATFYTMFHLEPVGSKAHVQVCGTTPCMLRGAGELISICRSRINDHPHHLSADGAFSWEEVECLGACVNAPMVQVSKDTYEDLTPESFEALLDAFARGERPKPGTQIARQFSAPVTGRTTLLDIVYADDDVPHPLHGHVGPAEVELAAHARGPAPPAMAVSELPGGEAKPAEQLRRKGRTPKKAGGADPAGPGTANQEIGRADAAGRSDEAASRAMRDPAARRVAKGRAAPVDKRSGGDKAAQPRSDRDSPTGDKEG